MYVYVTYTYLSDRKEGRNLNRVGTRHNIRFDLFDENLIET